MEIMPEGERITYAASYAKRLRNALKVAGITRPELFKSREVTLQLDFHSFRHAYATAFAEVDADGRLSMRLTDHKSLATHNLYVMRRGTMRVANGALPKVPLKQDPVSQNRLWECSAVQPLRGHCSPLGSGASEIDAN